MRLSSDYFSISCDVQTEFGLDEKYKDDLGLAFDKGWDHTSQRKKSFLLEPIPREADGQQLVKPHPPRLILTLHAENMLISPGKF